MNLITMLVAASFAGQVAAQAPDNRLGKPTKEQITEQATPTTTKGSTSNSSERNAKNPTVTQGLKTSREAAPKSAPGPKAGGQPAGLAVSDPGAPSDPKPKSAK